MTAKSVNAIQASMEQTARVFVQEEKDARVTTMASAML